MLNINYIERWKSLSREAPRSGAGREGLAPVGQRKTLLIPAGLPGREKRMVAGSGGKSVKGVAFVKTKSVQEAKNGPALFLDLVFRNDPPGPSLREIPARLWEGVDRVSDQVESGTLIYAEGQEIVFNGENQIRLSRIQPLKATPEEIREYIPRAAVSATNGMERLREYLASLEDPCLRAVGLGLLDDPEVRQAFPVAPAAKKNHHASLGGLLEHTLEIMEMGHRIAPVLGLNRDLLLLGLFLHDIGKCWEISSRPGFSYTDEGRLVGHMYLGCEKVAQVARQIEGFPETYLRVLQHFILSHHGEMAYGSPVLPSTPEAMAVHFLDNLSGQVNAMRKVQPQDKDQWGFEKNRGAYIWKKGSDPSAWEHTPLGEGGRKVFDR
ncbi:3'-5' exoribonuclease YhaM family protein [Leptospirillum ferriphilum]|uniref:3'-5' exoribonuclease YhaM family protein n=1 Tax=Leptospirillum ferriphilum TaxID=178606 RepID=UPI001EF02D7F|nr:HD domain-containing protein [Leptospirillum ferriphilum]